MLVTTPLNGDNFNTWYRSMCFSLRARNKLDFVDGTIYAPDPKLPTYQQWVRANDMVSLWLMNSMIPDLATSIIMPI